MLLEIAKFNKLINFYLLSRKAKKFKVKLFFVPLTVICKTQGYIIW